MMSLEPTRTIWMDGEFVSWEEAKIHVLTHTLHYGLGVFEGIRCYSTERGAAVFRLKDHVERFENSAKLVKMEIPYSVQELMDAIGKTVRENEVEECYIRPIAFYGYGKMGLNPEGSKVSVAIAVWPWGPYLGEGGLDKGVRATISSWRRIHPSILPPQAKLVGNYANSILAKLEALENGYDEAILLNLDGYLTEGPGENLFIVEAGELLTPPLTSGALKGITRDSVIQIARDKEIPVEEVDMTKDRLLGADEAFFTGTATEVAPIVEVDGKQIGSGKKGEVTEEIQDIFFEAIRGKEPNYEGWLNYI